MKKIKILLVAALTSVCVILSSCASMGGTSEPLDQGYYPAGEEAETSVEIIVGPNLTITAIDDGQDTKLHMYTETVAGWTVKTKKSREQLFRLSPGVHTVSVCFDNGQQYTLFANTMIIMLQEGNQYKITYEIVNGSSVVYDCINTDTLESAKLDREALAGNGESVMSAYIDAVLNPTMDGVGQTVIQENDEYVLTTYPGLKFELFNKKTGTTEKGMRTFVTDFSFKSGTVYLCVTDMTDKDEFLNSDYANNSKYVFDVKACDRKTVTYTFQKPEDKAGQTITFNISVKE